MKKILGWLMAAAVICVGFLPVPVFADDKCTGENQVEVSILGNDGCADVGSQGEGIFSILNVVLNVMTAGVGILAVIGFVITGIQYLTARDNDGQIAKAKMRMLQIVIGLFVYTTMWAILSWILPGGIGK